MDFLLALTVLLRVTNFVAGIDYPNFDIRVGQTLDESTAYLFKSVPLLSNCRQLCFEDDQCAVFRAEPFSYRWKCFLFRYGLTHKLLNESCTSVHLAVKRAPGSSLAADGFYYYMTAPPALDYTTAKAACQTFPNFRLALIKTIASFNVAKKLAPTVFGAPWLLVDLLRNGTNYVFGDGTNFQSTGVANQTITLYWPHLDPTVFVVYGNAFLEGPLPTVQYTGLCQGNPLGN